MINIVVLNLFIEYVDDTVFEAVTPAEAGAGLVVEFSDDDGHRVIEASEVEALQLAS